MVVIVGVFGLLLLGGGVYLWWQRTPLTPGSLARRAPIPPTMTLRKATVIGSAIVVLLICLVAVHLVRKMWTSRKQTPAPIETPGVQSAKGPVPFLDQFPGEYPTVFAPKKAEAALPPKGVPVTVLPAPLQQASPAPSPPFVPDRTGQTEIQQAAVLASLQEIAQSLKAQQARPQTSQVEPGQGQRPAQTPPVPSRKKDWKSLVKEDEKAGHEIPSAAGLVKMDETQTLIQPAEWAIPLEPLKTIYRSMRIAGRLLDSINTDIPASTIRIQLFAPLYDKFHYHKRVLDAGSIIIAQQIGKAEFGQRRVSLKIEQIELPTGEVIRVEGGVGDEKGAAGIPGKVNTHIGSLLLATGINAVMSIGIKSAAGTPGAGQYYQNPVQSAAQEAGQSVAQDVNAYTRQVLKVPPTIEVDAEDPKKPVFVSIALLKNIQLNREPIVAR